MQTCRKIYFTNPVVTNKVRLDQLTGARDMAFKVEFLGLDMTTRNMIDSQQPAQILKTGIRD
jgi:hypothetical protein